nr:immunoglobulin heavy chain junction region [Mus musculus]
CASEVFW